MGEFLHHLPRLRAGDRQADEAEIERFDGHRTVGRQMLLEPAHVIILGDAGADDEEVPFPELGKRKVADQLAVVLQHRRQHHAADGGNAGGEQPVEPGFRAWAADLVFGEAGGFHQADAVAHGFRFRADRLEIRRAPPGEFIRRAIRREPQRAFQPVGGAEHRAGLLQPVVDRRGQQRAGAGQFLVRIADREAARIVFAHLGIGIGERRIIAVAADIHGEDVETGIAMDHPVGERQPDAAALRKAGHDGAGRPEIGHAAHRPDQRIAIRREGEGAVDDAADAGLVEGREMAEADFQLAGNALDILGQQFMAEIPGRGDRRPRAAVLFIGAHQHAVAFLADIDLAVEIDAMHQFLAGRPVEVDDLGHVLGDQVHVLHGENRQFQPDHAPDFTRPEAGGIDDMLGANLALVGDHPPGAVLKLDEILDLGVQLDLGAVLLRRPGIGMGGAVGIEMALMRIENRADELVGIEQRHHLMRLAGGDQHRLAAGIFALGEQRFHPVEALAGGRQHQARGHVQADILAGIVLDLLVEVDGVFLQLGDVRIAVDGVHAAGGMPGRAGGQFGALQQHDIGPAEFRQMIENGTADDATTDDDDLGMAFHVGFSETARGNGTGAPMRDVPEIRNLMRFFRAQKSGLRSEMSLATHSMSGARHASSKALVSENSRPISTISSKTSSA